MSAIYPNTLHISISNPYQAYITRIQKNLRELIRFMDFSKPFQAKIRLKTADSPWSLHEIGWEAFETSSC
jgi:hypothetical protein